jgi:lysylphosphatidylglycerol synthetase-like protein (DUF2156 family)
VIDDYLVELSRHLRAWPWRRRRILAEVEAHLADAGGDENALARFGTPKEVAMRFNELPSAPHPRLAALVALGGVVVVFGAVQGLESHIPPAPWPEGDAPAGLETLFNLATVLLLAAIVLAVGALVVRQPQVALASCLALGATVLLLAVHAFRRAELVAGSPPSWQLLLVTVAALTAPFMGAALALRRA